MLSALIFKQDLTITAQLHAKYLVRYVVMKEKQSSPISCRLAWSFWTVFANGFDGEKKIEI